MTRNENEKTIKVDGKKTKKKMLKKEMYTICSILEKYMNGKKRLAFSCIRKTKLLYLCYIIYHYNISTELYEIKCLIIVKRKFSNEQS